MGEGHEVHRLSEHEAPRFGARGTPGLWVQRCAHYTGNGRPMLRLCAPLVLAVRELPISVAAASSTVDPMLWRELLGL